MEEYKNNKIERVLRIYTKLIKGNLVNKREEAYRYGVNERSIQRDIDDIRNFLESEVENTGNIYTVIYENAGNGYRIEQGYGVNLSNSEILALCKILLDSRAFTKVEMTGLLDRMIACFSPREDRKLVEEIVKNERFHYVELQHKTPVLNSIWEISKAIRSCQYIEIKYEKIKDRAVVKRKVKPVAIMFSEYYFYLAAFIEDEDVRKDFDVVNDSFPTIYRIDRIKKLKVLEEHFCIPYSNRFKEGEFRKRIHFMYGGVSCRR